LTGLIFLEGRRHTAKKTTSPKSLERIGDGVRWIHGAFDKAPGEKKEE